MSDTKSIPEWVRNAAIKKPPENSSHLSLVYDDPRKLKPNPKNPRHHSKKHIRQVTDSIKTFGFVVPILTDTDGVVIRRWQKMTNKNAINAATYKTFDETSAAGGPHD